jgi:glycosyltransferase involved in cell wall biosynthesis
MHRYDAVIIQRRLPSPAEALLWRNAGALIVFDFDDALIYRRLPKRGSYESATRRRRFDRMKRAVSAFTCGSASLARLVEDTSKPLAVLPTAVSIDVPQRARSASDGPLRLGWIGYSSNLVELEPLRGVFAALQREFEFEVDIIADAPWDAPGVTTRFVPWTLNGQAGALAQLDVGIMPLADSPWNRGKCAYKLLQYMAAGVCAIGSPVGMNSELIQHDANGLLASSPSEWHAVLSRTLADAQLRARLGAAGRATVERGFAFPILARRWMEFLQSLVAT